MIKDTQLVGLDEPFPVYVTCCRILRDADDPRWGGLLRTARRLLEQWDTINDNAALVNYLALNHVIIIEDERQQFRVNQRREIIEQRGQEHVGRWSFWRFKHAKRTCADLR